MLKNFLIILFCILSIGAKAQDTDSLIVVHKGAASVIRYTIKPGETMQMLARRFNISEGMLAYANEVEGSKKTAPGDVITIPVTKENYFSNKQPLSDLHELYYHVAGPKDNISLISTYSFVTKDKMREWNNLHGYTLETGQTLFIGWLKIVSRDTSNPISMLAYPAVKKAASADQEKMTVAGGLDSIFNRQTNNGTSVLTEKGTAVFFDKPGKNSIYYAFHTASPHGTVIKVTNPGTGKTVYVKVLDKIPDTKLYSNSIIGISNSAREALGVTDNKAWVEISYPTN